MVLAKDTYFEGVKMIPKGHFSLPAVVGILGIFSILWPDIAHSARSYREDPLVKQSVKGAGSAKVQALIKANKAMRACEGNIVKSRELQGTVCRLQVLEKLTAQLEHHTPWLVKQKLAIAQATFKTFLSIQAYEPIDPPPKFTHLQYQAGAATCATIENVLSSLSQIRNTGGYKPAFKIVQKNIGSFPLDKNTKGLREGLCACAKKWLPAADKAFKSMEEKGAIQRILTSRGCFLDMEKAQEALSTSRKAGPTQLSGRAKETAAQESDEQRILDYAQTRDFTLNRCRNKIGPTKVNKPEKVQQCLCREIKRWRFPARKDSTSLLSAVLPIEEKMLGLRINVDPKGKVQQCGPLEGPKAPPLKP